MNQSRTSVVSNRELLRMASEAAAKTEAEKDHLKEYKKTVGAMDSLTAEIEKQKNRITGEI